MIEVRDLTILLKISGQFSRYFFFRASWKTEPQDCGGELIATPQEQVMTSYNYPLEYPGGLECLYILKTQQGRVITLEILDLDLEAGKGGNKMKKIESVEKKMYMSVLFLTAIIKLLKQLVCVTIVSQLSYLVFFLFTHDFSIHYSLLFFFQKMTSS